MIFDKAGSRRGQLFLSSILANPDERFPEPSDAPSLIALFKLRNKLVHARQGKLDIATFDSDMHVTAKDTIEKPSPYNIEFENTKHYIETVQSLMKILQKLDPENISDWLNQNDWAEPIIDIKE